MYKKFFSFLFSFSHLFILQAQNIKISGTAKTFENSEIAVFAVNDFVSNTEKRLTFSTIDSTGNFLLEFTGDKIQYITLKIDKNVSSLYVEPNANYEIKISPPDSGTYINPNLERDVKMLINLKSKTEINALTLDYDNKVDGFLSREYKSFVGRNPQVKIDSFKVQMHRYYSNVKNDYFLTYIDYSVAGIEEKVKTSQKKLYSTYLDQKPILYDHQEYFNFFNTFYKQYLRNFSSLQGAAFVDQINNSNFKNVMNILKKGEFMENDTVRELVLIKGLLESYYDGTFKKESIIKLLEHIVHESKIQRHQQIAQNILNSFSKLKPGALAPNFVLPDKAGQAHGLYDLHTNKYVYIFFFDQSCSACLQQMKIVSSLKRKYDKWIEFVGISVDKNNADLKNFCLKNPAYDFLFLFDNSGSKLKDDYEIKLLPAYFLIDMEGKFVQVPAEGPEGNIDRAFYDISKPKNKKHAVGDKSNK